MSTQYRLVQSGKTASGGCSAGQGSSEPVAPRIYLFLFILVVSELRTDSIIRAILTLVIRGHWKEIEFEIHALDDGQNLETQKS
jgi:hypothetical protein